MTIGLILIAIAAVGAAYFAGYARGRIDQHAADMRRHYQCPTSIGYTTR